MLFKAAPKSGLATAAADALLLLLFAGVLCYILWAWHTHKTSHSCCKICGLIACRLFKAEPKMTTKKKNKHNFTLIWLNGFIALDICSFVYGPKYVDIIAMLLLLLLLFMSGQFS